MKYVEYENEQDNEIFAIIRINNEDTIYMVSNRGYVVSKNYRCTKTTVRLNPEINHGYERVSLYVKGKIYHRRVHRLVAEAFIPNPNNLPVCHHKDDNKRNNDVKNLEWTTSQQNTAYAVDDKLFKTGINHPNAVATEEQIISICECLEENRLSIREISEKCGVSINIVYAIIYGNKWKSISCDYNISDYNVRCISKYTKENVVIQICELIKLNKYTNKEIAKICNVNLYIVNDIKRKKTFKYISDLYF